jgi:transcriptional regulator with XRE-family HTH domain
VEALREIRRQKGWSQKDLADESGVGQDTISGIESGRHEPRPSTLRKLAKALDIEVRELFEEPVPLGKAPSKAGPPSPEPSLFKGLEDERRAAWEAAVDDAHRLREGGRARLEELLAAWQASTERGELDSARRGYVNEMKKLFYEAYGATHSLADVLFAAGGIPAPNDWEEVTAADRFYRTLAEVMKEAGFRIEERKGEPLKFEEPNAA